MKRKHFIIALMAMLSCFAFTAKAQVAKVGETGYATIDEAISKWTNGTTLTLLQNVTLSDVVVLKSTEHHILNLGTYTMTAASGKNAIVIKACGTGDSERTAITIDADAINPGGINAGSKCVVYYKYADGGISGTDRPIIMIKGGVFTGSTSTWGTAGIYTIGTEARKCATLNISGGTFNCSINGSGKSKLIISGGVFNYSVGSQGDKTAYRLISGAKFKTFGFMTADSNNTKFWFGTSMANSNVGLYVDDEGYLCVGGPVITELSPKYKAVASNATKWSSYLTYSSAATNGLYYTNAEAAIKKHGAANVTVYEHAEVVEELDNNAAVKDFTPELPSEVVTFEVEAINIEATTEATTKVTFNVEPKNASGQKVSNPTAEITFRLPVPAAWSGKANVYHEGTLLGAYDIKEESGAKYVEVSSSSFSEFSVEPVPPVAQIGEQKYATLDEAITAAQAGETIILNADVELTAQVVIPEGKELTLDLNGKTVHSVFNGNSTTNHIYALSNKGTLTIQDSKGNGSINSRGIYNYGSLTLNAGAINAIDGNGGYAVNNQSGSTFVMNGGVVAATNEDDHQSSSGGYDATALKVPAGCTATLNGGTINNVCDFTYAIDAAGTLNIPETSAITVNGTHGAIAVSGGVTTIDAGTFQIPADNYNRSDNVLYVSGGSLVVNGGTFIGDSDTAAGGSCLYDAAGKAVVNGGTFKGSSGGDVWGTTGTTIKGGTFENLTEKQHIAAGYELNADGTVAAKSVASINGTKYTSLSEAVDAVQNGETITLIDNVVLAERVTIPANKTLTIDLNGKSISMEESIIATAYAINNLGNLTITDGVGGGSINARGVYNGYGDGGANVTSAAITVSGGTFNAKGTNGGAAIFNYGTANVNGGKFTSIGGYSLNNQAGAKMNITDGVEVTGGIYNNSNAELIVDGGNISNNRSGCHTIYAWNAKVTVNGGSIHNENSGNATIMSAGSSVVAINGGTISIKDGRVPGNGNTWTSCLTDAANTAQIIVNGGTLNGGFRVQSGATMTINGGSFNDVTGSGYNVNTGAIVEVKGGTFTDAAAQKFAKDNIADDYKLGEDGKVVYAPVVAKIGETKYETLDAAVAAAKEGDKITLLNDAELLFASNPMYNNVYASEIDLKGKTMTIKKGDVRFSNTTIKNGNIIVQPGTYNGTAIFLMYSKNLTLESVKVTATGVVSTYLFGLEGTSNLNLLNGSEIVINNESLVNIGSIIADNGNGNTVTIKDSKIDIKNSDARLYLGGTNGNITVENSDIDLNGVKEGFYLRAGQTLAITGNSTVDITLNTNEGRYGINMTDITATYTKAETATVNATLKEVTPAAVIGTQKFATLQAAINAVKNGETIILQNDCAEAVTFTQTKEVSFVLDGNNKTYTGSINITARAGKDAPSTLVIKNFNFKTDVIAHDFIKSVETNYYPNNITISNCKFEGTADINTENYAVVAVRLKSANNIKIENCKGSGLHSFLQNTAGWNMQIDNVDVTNSLSGFAMGTVQGADIKNCDLTVNKSGIRFDAQLDNNAVITDNKINAFIPVVVRKASVESSLTFNGENTMTATNTDGLWMAVGTSEYVENGKMPTDATGKVRVTLNDTGLNAAGVYGDYVPVAKIGDVEYTSLEAAFAAATEGQTITMLDDATPALTSQRAITKAAVIDLGAKTMTLTEDDLYFGTTKFKNGTIVVDPSVKPSTAVFWMFANQTLTFDNVKIVATGVTGTYLIGLDGNNSDLNLLNGSEILVENTTALDLDIICVNASTGNDIKVENSKVNVTNLDGRVFFRGNYTVKDSEVNLAGITKAGSRIEAGQTLSIEGTSNVNIEGELRDGGIHMTDLSATYTKAETATVNATVNEPKVAKVGENTYRTLAEAIAAAQAGDEIVMLADATVEGTLALPAGIKLTSNGHTINGSIRMLGDLELNGALTITGGLWVGKSGETLTATLSGGKLTANYFMFQHGTYTINADIDAVYGYLSYEATFEVNSTIHTTGANGEVLYINGNVTLNDGAVLDSDNSVFVCNDNAVLTLKPGSKVDSNVSITTSGAKVYIDATGMTAGASANITGTVDNSGNGTIAVIGNDNLEAKIVNGKVVLAAKPVAKIGETYYATLQDAVNASPGSGWGAEVTLLKDITLEGGYADADEGLRIEKSVTINGAGHTIDCGQFVKGIRIYQNADQASNVMFKNINIVNNNAKGRCIDTRSGKINLMLSGGVNLTAHGTNSQPLTIGGSEAMTKVTISGGTIDAGTSGYAVICFVPVTNHINVQGNAVIKGLAAFYLKEGVTKTAIKLQQSTSIGTNKYAAASGDFGAIVIEGSNNTVRLEHSDAVVKAVAADGAEMAAQAAFLLRGNNNTVGYYNNANAQVVTEGAQAYWTLSDADVTGTKYERNGVEMLLEAETRGYQFITVEDALRYAKNGDTVKLLANAELDETYVNEKSLTLDLNGKTLSTAYVAGSTTNHLYAIQNNAELTITDSSDAKTGKISARGNFNYGTLTLEAGTIEAIDGNGGYAVRNYAGSFTMNGGTIATTLEDDHQVDNGGYDATTVRVDEGATFTMNGGELNNICDYTFAIDNYGTTTVKGGKATSVHTTVANYGTINIEGGEFTCNGLEGITAHAVWAAEGTTNISGGTFDGKDNYNGFNVCASKGANVVIEGGNFLSVHSGSLYGDGTITVSGGTFFDKIDDARCVVGFQAVANEYGTYTVKYTGCRNALTIDVAEYKDKYENTQELFVETLTFKRTLNAGAWNAFFVPFEVPLSALMDNYDVAYLNDASFYDRDENGSIEEITVQYVKFTEAHKDKKLFANHPYRIRPKNADAANMNLVLTDVELQTTEKDKRKVLRCGGVYTNIEWHGLYERSYASDFLDGNNVNDMCYAENSKGTFQNIGTYSVAPFRVMMVMTHSDEMPYTFDEEALSNVRTITLGEDEFDATGIINIGSDQDNSDLIFDLQGRRVQKPVKGNLYIINGKKVVY